MTTIGIIGHGYVGKAMERYFQEYLSEADILIYDKAEHPPERLLSIAANRDFIFVCVPTPMAPDGRCHTGIVESVLYQLDALVERKVTVIIKSTVPPGFTTSMESRFWHLDRKLVFSPEFLTEKNFINDVLRSDRVVLGGGIDATTPVAELFRLSRPGAVMRGTFHIIQCGAREAELVKLFANGLLMTKVLFCNEMYQVCKRMNVDYNIVRNIAVMDERIGRSHTFVPGHDGELGAGGHCFPKDMNSLRAVARDFGIPEKLFTAVLDRNDELRVKKDWLEMKGRAVL